MQIHIVSKACPVFIIMWKKRVPTFGSPSDEVRSHHLPIGPCPTSDRTARGKFWPILAIL
jgi:hypothetical protein